MTAYYFISTALPALTIGEKPEISFAEFYTLLLSNLSSKDLEKVDVLIWLIDLANIRSFWMGIPMDSRGKLGPKELEEAVLVQEGLPEYVLDFLNRYESTTDRLRYFASLYSSFYKEELTKLESGFLKNYLTLDREIRLVLTALRAKSAGRDVVRELQFEDFTDPLVMEVLAQKDSHDYIPPPEYEDLKFLYLNTKSEPKELYRSLLEYRFKKVEEMEENEHFSIDRILGYFVRLMIVESWEALNEEQGLAITEDLSKYG